MKALEWSQHFSHCKSTGIFFPEIQGQLTLLSKVQSGRNLNSSFYGSPGTCKNEGDPFKNEGTRALTRLYAYFSDTQGQLTPQSVEKSG